MSDLFSLLRCPQTGGKLIFDSVNNELISESGGKRYQIRNGIPRFVCSDKEYENFSLQWQKFAKAQLDSHTKTTISRNRFFKATGWDPAELNGKLVLDAGCGSGRFAEIALSCGAIVVCCDISEAVNSCFTNLDQERMLVVQADLLTLPFDHRSFDYIYSLGVIQHTKDPETVIRRLIEYLRPGGSVALDFYEKRWSSLCHPKYVLRPLTKHLNGHRLLSILEYLIPHLLRLSRFFGKFPLLGRYLRRFIPVADYSEQYPELSSADQLNFSILDTFDWLNPKYDYPQSEKKVRRYMKDMRIKNIRVTRNFHLEIKGTL